MPRVPAPALALVAASVLACAGLSGAEAATCSPYFKSGEWIYRFNEWTLSLVPTDCTRALGAADQDRAFAEVVVKFASNEHWENTDGLRKQLFCHFDIAKNKAEWNIDPYRPNVNYDATVKAGCNP